MLNMKIRIFNAPTHEAITEGSYSNDKKKRKMSKIIEILMILKVEELWPHQKKYNYALVESNQSSLGHLFEVGWAFCFIFWKKNPSFNLDVFSAKHGNHCGNDRMDKLFWFLPMPMPREK